MWSTQTRHAAFGAIGENSTPEKEGLPGLDKSNGRPKRSQKSSKHCQGPYIDFDIDALWQNGRTSTVIPHNLRAV